VNEKKENAKLSDIFFGNEIGNNDTIDLSKVQLAFFTFIFFIGYIFATLISLIRCYHHGISSIDGSMVPLLGVSHGGYLVSKGIPNTKTQ